jgi:hypothetical protein
MATNMNIWDDKDHKLSKSTMIPKTIYSVFIYMKGLLIYCYISIKQQVYHCCLHVHSFGIWYCICDELAFPVQHWKHSSDNNAPATSRTWSFNPLYHHIANTKVLWTLLEIQTLDEILIQWFCSKHKIYYHSETPIDRAYSKDKAYYSSKAQVSDWFQKNCICTEGNLTRSASDKTNDPTQSSIATSNT